MPASDWALAIGSTIVVWSVSRSVWGISTFSGVRSVEGRPGGVANLRMSVRSWSDGTSPFR